LSSDSVQVHGLLLLQALVQYRFGGKAYSLSKSLFQRCHRSVLVEVVCWVEIVETARRSAHDPVRF
jgi:hypothetical protein